MPTNFAEIASFIWSVADDLRGDYKQADYGKIILPFTVLRRLDCILAPTKVAVLKENDERKKSGIKDLSPFLTRKSKHPFYNVSKFDLAKLLDDQKHTRHNLIAYLGDFSPNARDIFERFRFQERIGELDDKNLLYHIIQKFVAFDLRPERYSNHDMGLIFEELIRRFAETSNETAGEHFTPRDVIKLMVNILFAADDSALAKPGIVRSLYDPAAGTGGMLSVAEEHLRELNAAAKLVVFGQELNEESYAICKSDMMIKGQDPNRIIRGNTLSNDNFPDTEFDYLLSNPPFGVKWEKVQDAVRTEHQRKGFAGRFGAGLPSIDDGSMLFLQHLISKMNPKGSRIGIVLSGSSLFTGDAGGGESEIRRWILENDWLDVIIAIPNNFFYNTDIAAYIWCLSNRKPSERKGKVQLIDATGLYTKMRKSLGKKRYEFTEAHIAEVTKAYGAFKNMGISKIFDTTDFGYRKVTIERPLRLRFQVSPEGIATLNKLTPFKKFKAEEQKAIISAITTLKDTVYTNREHFRDALVEHIRALGLHPSKKLTDPVCKAFGQQDEEADICLDDKGNPEHDPELRDSETVPLKESIERYFEREVKPFVPDAWVSTTTKDCDKKDGKPGKVGYEINFTRHFYVYKPPRPLEEIRADIVTMEQRFMELLKKISV